MEVVSTLLDSYLADGYAIVAQGNYAYATAGGTTNRFSIIDFSDLDNPEIVGSVQDNTKLSNARAIAVDGDYAYVCGLDYDAILVIDISNKTNPYIAAELVDSTYLNGASRMDKRGNYLYIGCGMTPYYLTIVDVSTPLSPSIEGYTDTVGIDAAYSISVYSDDYAFCCNKLVDISNKTAPAYVKDIAFQGGGFVAGATPYSSKAEGNYLFVNSYNSAYNYKLFSTVDISDLDNPFIVSVIYLTQNYSFSMEIVGNYIYVNSGDLVELINFSLVNKLTCQGIARSGLVGLIDSAGEYFYNFTEADFEIFDASDMSLVNDSFAVALGTIALNAFQDGNYIIAGGNNYLKIIDVSNKTSPSVTGSLTVYSSFTRVRTSIYKRDGSSNYIFLLRTNGLINRANISNKNSPTNEGFGLYVDNLLDVRYGKLFTIVSNDIKVYMDSSPYIEIGSHAISANYDSFRTAWGDAINGTSLYIIARNITTGFFDILAFDISDTSDITLSETFDSGITYNSFYFNYHVNRGEDVLYCDYGGSLYVYDISDGISLEYVITNYFMKGAINRRQIGIYEKKIGIPSSSSVNTGFPFIADLDYGVFSTNTINKDDELEVTGASFGILGLHSANGYLYTLGDGGAYVITTREDPDPPAPGDTFTPRVMLI